MPLTDTAIRAARPKEKPYKLADSGGLFLYVAPKGGKLWRMKYRHAGKEGLLSFGPYPAVSLKAAREKRDEARRQIEGDRNPAVEKRRQEARARLEAATTFKAVADEVIAKAEKEGKAPSTLRAAQRYLSLLRKLHASPVADIEPIELLEVLRPLEAKGRHETALKTRAFAGRVFRHAVLTARAKANPAEALRGALTAPKVTHLAAILEPAQVGALMRAIEGYDGQPSTRLALQLMAHLFVRPGELRQARWSEIDFEAAVWRIPAARMKMKREHVVPLSRQALEAFRQVQAIHPGGPFVFPSLGSLDRPMSENTLNAALRLARLRQGRDDLARLPRHGLDAPERERQVDARRHRARLGPCGQRRSARRLSSRRALAGAREDDALVVRSPRRASGRRADPKVQEGRLTPPTEAPAPLPGQSMRVAAGFSDDESRQAEPESGRQGKRSASDRAHVVEGIEDFGDPLETRCWRICRIAQQFQCSESRRRTQAGAPSFENIEHSGSGDGKLCLSRTEIPQPGQCDRSARRPGFYLAVSSGIRFSPNSPPS